ncbi:hypothetical protein GGF38_001791, partial [Coemansia sp. RSA 25]
MGKSGRSSSRRRPGRSGNRQLPAALAHSQSDRTADATGAHSSSGRAYPGHDGAESLGHTYPDVASPVSPARERQQHHFLERQMSDHQISDMARGRGTSEGFVPAHLRRRRSIDSYRSRSGSENPNLASVISQYMHGIDAESTTDMMAARYYGNMAQIPEDTDRLPRPMNSTLPLFSISVMNGGRNLRAHSPHDSDESSQRRRSRFIRTRTNTEGALPGLSPVSVPAPKADLSALLDEHQLEPTAEEPPAEISRRKTYGGDALAFTRPDQ